MVRYLQKTKPTEARSFVSNCRAHNGETELLGRAVCRLTASLAFFMKLVLAALFNYAITKMAPIAGRPVRSRDRKPARREAY